MSLSLHLYSSFSYFDFVLSCLFLFLYFCLHFCLNGYLYPGSIGINASSSQRLRDIRCHARYNARALPHTGQVTTSGDIMVLRSQRRKRPALRCYLDACALLHAAYKDDIVLFALHGPRCMRIRAHRHACVLACAGHVTMSWCMCRRDRETSVGMYIRMHVRSYMQVT